ncbi:MAG: hypothetical protein GY796_29600 [Chloroflexi bacterium]|nr:hypothetical protein [Chloroflexota bacterium]
MFSFTKKKSHVYFNNHLAAIITFTFVYILLTWPLAIHFNEGMLGSFVGDGWEEVEQFWWFKHTLIDQHTSPFFDPLMFYPEGWNVITGSHSPTLMIPTIPLTIIFGPVGAFNIAMFLSFLFAALGSYLLIVHLTQKRFAGLIAGIVFAFTMSRLLRIGGHFNTAMGSAWIPWVFLCLERGRTSQNHRWRWFAAASACYAGSVLSYFYFVYIIAVPIALYFIIEIWQSRTNLSSVKQRIFEGLLTFGVAAVLVAPFALMAFAARNQMDVPGYSLEYTASRGISPDRLFIPNRYHPLWGNWFKQFFPDQGEKTFVFLGLTAIVLAGIAVLKKIHSRSTFYFLLVLVTLLIGMGPYLQWNAQFVTLPISISGLENPRIPLPGILLFLYAPMFNVIRVWARFGLVTSFAVATLAGFAASHFQKRPRWGLPVVLILLFLVILESFGHPFGYVSANEMVREVDVWLEQQPESTAVLELPLSVRQNGSLLYSRMLHGQPIASGYATALSQQYHQNAFVYSKFPNQETVNILQNIGVSYLLYTVKNETQFKNEVEPAINELLNLDYIQILRGHPGQTVYIYRVKEPE